MAPRILVIAYMATHFREMFRAAKWCRQTGRYEPVVFFPETYRGLDDDIAKCEAAGIRWLRPDTLFDDPPLPPPATYAPRTRHWKRRLTSLYTPFARIPFRLLPAGIRQKFAHILRRWRPRAPRSLNRLRITWMGVRVRMRHAVKLLRMRLRLGTRLRRLFGLPEPVPKPRRPSARRLRSMRTRLGDQRRALKLGLRKFIRAVRGLAQPPARFAARCTRWFWRHLRGLAWAVRHRVRDLSGDLPLFAFAMRHYRREKLQAAKLIEFVKPSLLLLPEDNVNYSTAAIIKAAQDVGAPTVIIPFTLVNPREPAEAFFARPEYQLDVFGNRLIARYRPRWKLVHRGRSLVRMPWYWALAKELRGLAPPMPWFYNSGDAAAIALESEEARRVYSGYGFPNDQLVVTGNLRMDELACMVRTAPERRHALLEELGLAQDRRLILCALTVDLVKERPECGFASYDELVESWIRTLTALPNVNVIVNLHPSLDYDRLRYIEAWGCRIVREDVTTLIPLCDIYNVCVSATTVMAVACGKPVVNYDVYRFGYDDFARARGVVTISRPADFARIMNMLVTDPAFFDDLTARQQGAASEWGLLDGRVGERLGTLFDRLSGRPTLTPS